jgi:hypothetical protein
MIKHIHSITNRFLESEAEKAARKFFGTFVKDIKRNWADSLNKIKKNKYHHVSQLTSPI